jgi:hypothetical protein
MWCRSYRNHVIMAFPSFDTATSLWAPQASIAWVDGPTRKSEFVRFAKRVITEGDAVAVALRASHAWIDKRIRKSDKASPLETDNKVQSVAGASPQLEGDRAKLARAVKSSRSAPRMLTYAQFRSVMEKSGLGGSEQSLQKSYTALVQLRKQNHCSWAQIKLKMKHSQDSLTLAHPKAPKTKPSRLPLTLRDWRRVI